MIKFVSLLLLASLTLQQGDAPALGDTDTPSVDPVSVDLTVGVLNGIF